jgi:hypothetical protein
MYSKVSRLKPKNLEAETQRQRRRRAGFYDGLADACRELQKGVCAMPGCGQILTKTGNRGKHGECADHDHDTGKARGLLCKRCNVQLGAWEILEKNNAAREYIRNTPVMQVEAQMQHKAS